METFSSTQVRLKPPWPVVAIVAYLFVSALWFALTAIALWRSSPPADGMPTFSYAIPVAAMALALLSVIHLVSAAGLIGGGNWARLLYICGGAAANLSMLIFRDYWESGLMLISTASYIAVTWALTRHSVSDYLS
jgi:hypothetical protein